jgi:hypothetical protein
MAKFGPTAAVILAAPGGVNAELEHRRIGRTLLRSEVSARRRRMASGGRRHHADQTAAVNLREAERPPRRLIKLYELFMLFLNKINQYFEYSKDEANFA